MFAYADGLKLRFDCTLGLVLRLASVGLLPAGCLRRSPEFARLKGPGSAALGVVGISSPLIVLMFVTVFKNLGWLSVFCFFMTFSFVLSVSRFMLFFRIIVTGF